MASTVLDFGPYLRHVREVSGLSLRKVAAIYGVSVPYLSDVELGKRNPPTPEKWPALAKAYGCTTDDLEKVYRCPTCGHGGAHAA